MKSEEPQMRDVFAGFAMLGMLASWHEGNTGRVFDDESLAKDAYAVADAMLKERVHVQPKHD